MGVIKMIVLLVTSCFLINCVIGQTVWVNDMTGVRIPEDTPVGTVVYTLLATGAPNIKYYVTETDKFTVDSVSGEVKIRRLLDYETDSQLKVTWIAYDGKYSFDRTVFINVIDANDNKPAFVRTTNKASVPENAPIGFVLINDLEVTDRDTANSLIDVVCDRETALRSQYPTACELFKLNRVFQSNRGWRGTLTLNGTLDFETEAYYQMPVVIMDGKHNISQSIEINVGNIQDAPPVFVRAQDITVMEPVPVNQVLDYVSAVDGDTLNPRAIYYEIPAASDPELFNQFTLDGLSGNISNKVVLDREDPRFITGVVFFPIKAREILSSGVYGNDTSTTAEATIRIIIQDQNDNAPTFNPVTYNVSIPEDIPNRTPLPNLSLSVNDLDIATNAFYNLTLDSFNEVFEVSPVTGQGSTPAILLVRNTSLIDYERGPRRYEFRVIAREADTRERLSGTATVIVNILDINDNLPTFSQPDYERSISEYSAGGTPVVKIEATDPDSGILGTQGIRFGLIGDGSQLFNIDRVSGQITVANCATPGSGNCIDYERKKRYDLTVTAQDNDGNGQTVTINLVIKILDENDNPPTFANKDYTSYIEEKLTRPNPNVTVQAADRDSVGGPVQYSMLTDPSGLWQVDQRTGEVTAKQPIFYTDTPNNLGYFVMVVMATDGRYNDTANVKIYVIDINDNAPVFSLPSYVERINENTRGNVDVLTVTATDNDSPTTGAGVLDYSIVSGASGKFVINQTSGAIKTSPDASFDYDVQNRYTMIVMARDRGQPPLSATSTVIINIIDANNKLPYFQPSTQRADVYENVAVGFSVYTVKAFDPDANNVLNYFFTEPIEAITPDGVKVDRNRYDFTERFRIEEDTGIVRVNRSLDRDSASVITITMNVVDISASPPQTGTGTLIVFILEYNDQDPYFLPYTNLTINEEQPVGTFVVAMLARDDDDPIAEYNLIENPFNFFAIGYQTGVVSINSRIDFESVESTYFKVSVWDSGTPRRSSSAIVNITILNINDNSPVFNLPAYEARLPEHTPANTPVIQVQATDRDKGDYGNVRYSITDTRFNIDNMTGQISVAPGANLDRETLGDIDIQVTAYDSPLNAIVRRETVVTVYIYLEDINDNPPRFKQREYITTIFETIPVNTEVLQVFADDIDIGLNAELVFRKVPNSGDPDGYFSISERSGRIRVSRSLLKRSGTYVFFIEARDELGNGPFNDTAKVTVIVRKAVNSPPIWVIPPVENTTINVLEEQYLGMLVYHVHARDEDTGDSGIVNYAFRYESNLTTHTPEFRINPITGVIRAEKVYDRETVDKYLLLLVAQDKGNKSQPVQRYLNIQILDVNDNPPVFPLASNGRTRPYLFDVAENAPIGKEVGVVRATDRDLPGPASEIHYFIIGGNEKGLFRLDERTGNLTVLKQLDREAQGTYSIDIQATNNVSDYSVITQRKKRALDPSIVTAVVRVANTNDNPPLFSQDTYHGCISTRSSIGQSIVTVEAEDKDSASEVQYSISSGDATITADSILQIDRTMGIITNKVLMNNYAGRTLTLTATAADGQQTATATVLIFVTQPDSEVKLVINQPASEVRLFYKQIQNQLQELKDERDQNPFKYVCTSRIVDHVLSDGKTTALWSDMYISAICQNCVGGENYHIYSSSELITKLNNLQNRYKDTFDLYYIANMEEATAEKSYIDRTPTMVVMIIIIVLIVLALLLLIIAFCCIRRQRKEKQKLLQHRISERPIEPVQYDPSFQQVEVTAGVNPVYDNRGYVQDELQGMYAKVRKSPTSQRAPQPPPIQIEAMEAIDAMEVEIRDESPESSPPASPKETPRDVDPADEDYRIETEVM